jgi:hypothetical protein
VDAPKRAVRVPLAAEELPGEMTVGPARKPHPTVGSSGVCKEDKRRNCEVPPVVFDGSGVRNTAVSNETFAYSMPVPFHWLKFGRVSWNSAGAQGEWLELYAPIGTMKIWVPGLRSNAGNFARDF